MLQELRRRISATIYCWDCPSPSPARVLIVTQLGNPGRPSWLWGVARGQNKAKISLIGPCESKDRMMSNLSQSLKLKVSCTLSWDDQLGIMQNLPKAIRDKPAAESIPGNSSAVGSEIGQESPPKKTGFFRLVTQKQVASRR